MHLKLSLLILILSLSFPCAYTDLYSNRCTTDPFDCGGNLGYLTYPFWGGNRPQECGSSSRFELVCVQNIPMLNISSVSYRVQEIDFNNNTLRVARDDLLLFNRKTSICPPHHLRIPDTYFDPDLFKYMPNKDYAIITLYFGCKLPHDMVGLVNTFRCSVDGVETINLFGSKPDNVSCKDNIFVPINKVDAQSLGNPDDSSINVLRSALKTGFSIQWLNDGNENSPGFCNPHVPQSCITTRTCESLGRCSSTEDGTLSMQALHVQSPPSLPDPPTQSPPSLPNPPAQSPPSLQDQFVQSAAGSPVITKNGTRAPSFKSPTHPPQSGGNRDGTPSMQAPPVQRPPSMQDPPVQSPPSLPDPPTQSPPSLPDQPTQSPPSLPDPPAQSRPSLQDPPVQSAARSPVITKNGTRAPPFQSPAHPPQSGSNRGRSYNKRRRAQDGTPNMQPPPNPGPPSMQDPPNPGPPSPPDPPASLQYPPTQSPPTMVYPPTQSPPSPPDPPTQIPPSPPDPPASLQDPPIQSVPRSPVITKNGTRAPPFQSHAHPPQSDGNRGRSYNKRRRALGVVLVVTGIVFFITISAVLVWFIKRRCFPTSADQESNYQAVEAFLLQHGPLALKRYKYSEIKKMTKSLSDKLGQGGYGSVYKGNLPDDTLVAIKVLSSTDGNVEDFVNEVASISGTSHVNIINLLGFCFDRKKRALIYEYMPNNSLDKYISNIGSTGTNCCLDIEILYRIAVGVAEGLDYLHRCCNTRIVHFDIKPQNILLDEDFCPKISDFGLAKLCKKKQSLLSVLGTRGTVGYIAPEVFSRNFGGVSHKSDVYSYGMMVLEMAGANMLADHTNNTTQSFENYFPDKIYERVLDKTRNLDGFEIEGKEETARKMLLIGFWCIQTNPSDRPSISKVVEMFGGSIESVQIPPKPVLFTPTLPVWGVSSSFSSYVEAQPSAEGVTQTQFKVSVNGSG